jgi:hypothetical protein
MGLAATPLLCVRPAAGQDVATSAAGSPLLADTSAKVSTLPVLAEHRYRMLAKVRPLLFWITRDDVGGARITWRGDDSGAAGYELLIGSDPAKAPRKINRWGYIAEERRGTTARVLGVMKQSNEKSIEEAQSQIGASGSYVFKAIQASASGTNATAGVTTVRVARDFTYRELGDILDMVNTAHPDTAKATSMPAGSRPGFLIALAELIQQSVDAHGQMQSARTIPYVYNGAAYDLALRHTEYRDHVIRGDFESRSRSTGEATRFEVSYGASGELAGVPIHAIYQPRWWFEVQLFLDDAAQF